MANGRSFTAYVKDKFYNDIYPAVEDFIDQNWKGLDLRLRNGKRQLRHHMGKQVKK